MHFCKDCKWSYQERMLFLFHIGPLQCRAPQNKKSVDLVTGSQFIGYQFCLTHRSSPSSAPHDCGSEARFFTPKGTKP